MKQVLHVGSGPYNPEKLHPKFRNREWKEIRLDINPLYEPDIVGDICKMDGVEASSMDAVYSSHNIEHLYDHEVSSALEEFFRVLRPDGFALITCPDLKTIAECIVKGSPEDVLYTSPIGPISPIDMLYGHRASLADGNLFMAHKTGFTVQSLGQRLVRSGFNKVKVKRDKSNYALWAMAYK